MNPIAAQRLKSNNWDPAQSSVLKAIQAQWADNYQAKYFRVFKNTGKCETVDNLIMIEKWRK